MKHSNISIFIPHLGCPYNCIFCNQYKITGSDKAITPLDIYNILNEAYNNPSLDKKETQIAFFGGSFTAIDKNLMIEYLQTANEFIGKDGFDSIRISTRPDCIDLQTLDILKKYNVKTIELGIQSLDDTVLKLSKRGYTSKAAIEACELIKQNGFELGMQMMCGLPGDTFEKDILTAEKIIELDCKQVRIYPTLVIKDTPLEDMYNKGIYSPYDLNSAVEVCASLFTMFRQNDVTVLKIGLHSQSDAVAGPFHPAFGELVRSEVFYKEITSEISPQTPYLIEVAPSFISVANGNSKRNIERFKQNNYLVTIKQSNTILENYKIKKL